MDERVRTQALEYGAVVVFALGIVVLSELSSLAVAQWGVLAFVLILAAMVAAVFGLAAKGWTRRKGQDTWWVFVAMLGIITSSMIKTLGVPSWRSALLGIIVALAASLVISRGVPWWQSRRGDSHR